MFLRRDYFYPFIQFLFTFFDNYITRLYNIIVRREAVPLQGTPLLHREVNLEGSLGAMGRCIGCICYTVSMQTYNHLFLTESSLYTKCMGMIKFTIAFKLSMPNYLQMS